jgi:hypothetical protein
MACLTFQVQGLQAITSVRTYKPLLDIRLNIVSSFLYQILI